MSLDLHWLADAIAVLVAIGSIVFAALRLRNESKKMRVDIDATIDQRWQALTAALEARIDELVEQAAAKVKDSLRREERITELERIVDEQKKKLAKQEDELIQARRRIAELKVEVLRMDKLLKIVDKKTGPLKDPT